MYLIAFSNFSGAGKTTLLNALLRRNVKGLEIEGKVLVNGQEIGRKITKVCSSKLFLKLKKQRFL